MKRVGLFTFDFYPVLGGQGKYFYEISRRLSLRSPPTEFVAFSPCRNDLENHRSILPFVRRLPFSQLLFSLSLLTSIKKFIRNEKLDMIVVNGGPGGILLLEKPPVPLIYCCNHTYTQQSRLVERQFWKRGLVPLEKRSYSLADRCLAISTTTREELEQRYAIRAADIDIIRPGVDTEVFKPQPVEKLPHSIFYLGRLEPRKGIDFLLSTVLLVKAQIPDVVLYIGGSGGLKRSLESYVQKHDLTNNVVFLDYLSEDEIVSWYNKCPIHVVPSVFEGLGIVALESLACGGALITTRVPGLVDIVEDGQNGLLVDYGDREGLASKIVDLISDETKRRSLVEGGLQTVRERFSWDCVIPRYEKFFHDFILSHFGDSADAP